MDDVDRLFECFKCGVSPPQSALRVRKKSRNKIIDNGNVDSTKQNTKFSGFSTPGSSRQKLKNAADMQLCMEKLGSTEINPLKKLNSGKKKQISPVVFYGSPRGLPTKRPRRLLQLLHEIHNDLREGNDLNSRKDVWDTFPKQDQAIAFAKSDPRVRLFSYQDHLNGQRRFLVSTYREFWRRYKNMHSRFRHHYEVIQDGLPCHLYFDLEFNKKVNTNKKGEEMVDVLISVTLEALFDKYSIQGNHDWIVELDSSTEDKFSRHLVIRIPKTAFKDNLHAGAFVTEICSRICSARESDPRLEKLFVSKDSCSGEFPPQLFIDTGVYSRNRCFRLALSSKAGKSSVLLPTGRFKCKNMCEEAMFMASLICKMDDDCQKLLICKTDTECMKTLYFNSEVNSNFEDQSSAPQHKLSLEACFSNMPTTYLMGKSPFPAMDVFVESIASTGNVSGRIRSWYWFSDYGLMVYSMLRNRFCERIGREHKSNHVMYIVDFKRAVYYQKCYDPDCKGYRSPIRQIPWDVIPDTLPFLNPSHTGHYTSMTDAVDHQDDSNDAKHDLCDMDQTITVNDKKNDWWHEAIRIADDIENKRIQEHAKLEMVDDEDHEWWVAVEKTTSQAEQQSLSQLLDVA